MPLEVRESSESEVLVLELVGRLDSKTSQELEKSVAKHLGAGQRRFVLDLGAMEYVSSAGLRIFLMLGKKVAGGTGSLVLCSLNAQVKEVFEIAGFTRLFKLAATRAEALASGAPATPEASLAGRAAAAFGVDAPEGPPASAEVRELAARAAALLAPRSPGKGKD